jgi:serine/threonine-protein kinase
MNTIREAPFFLACLSNNSIDKRGVIQEEIREALDVWRQKLDSDIYFIPVRLEDCAVPGALAKFQWVDLFHDGGFERLKMAIDTGLERIGVVRSIRLRSEPLKNLKGDDVKLMLRENDFFHKDWYWMGKGVQHQYELLEDGKVVFDKTTGLTWQQSGSKEEIIYEKAERYIRDLNKKRFVGHNDWRLPTLEEAMSLMEPKKNKQGLYIDSVFDKEQSWIWTVDKESAGVAWVVSFYDGNRSNNPLDSSYYVRAVR